VASLPIGPPTGLSHLRSEVIFDQLSLEKPSHQILIPRLPRKSRQHFIARHFFRAHKFRTGVPSCTSSAVSPSVRRRLSVSNLSQYHITWSTVSQSFKLTAPSTILNLLKCDCTNDQTLFSTQKKQISCPPFDPQTKVEEQPSVLWSERSGLSKTAQFNPACHAQSSIISLPSRPT
jgi:hypothetical protein